MHESHINITIIHDNGHTDKTEMHGNSSIANILENPLIKRSQAAPSSPVVGTLKKPMCPREDLLKGSLHFPAGAPHVTEGLRGSTPH